MIFCMFFWFVGGLFASIGGWQVSQTSDYQELSNFATDPPLMFATLGCLVFVVSSFGVMGAYRENICCLRVYKIFLIIIIVFEFCAGNFLVLNLIRWWSWKLILCSYDLITNVPDTQHRDVEYRISAQWNIFILFVQYIMYHNSNL